MQIDNDGPCRSPYRRSSQTTEALASVFQEDEIAGFQEEVQLREQDFGNFQDQEGKKREKAERMRYGRFFYRCAVGEQKDGQMQDMIAPCVLFRGFRGRAQTKHLMM